MLEERISNQEVKDFEIAKEAIERVFKGAKIRVEKEPEYSHTDLRFTATTSNCEKYYNVELKERNRGSDEYDEVPLKISKYIDILNSTRDDENAFIFYIMPNEIWIFNLSKLDLNKVRLVNWEIKSVQYSENSRIIRTPTMFIPLRMACWNTIRK